MKEKTLIEAVQAVMDGRRLCCRNCFRSYNPTFSSVSPLRESYFAVRDRCLKKCTRRTFALKNNFRNATSKCPDCKGAGYWYPGGYDKGVAKCKHSKLHG
jgi:hypothetical protein